MFAPENWIITDNNNSNEPCVLFIDAFEDSVIEIYEKSVIITLNNELLLRRISVLQNIIIMLMSASVIERLDHFVSTYPNIVKRVPQKMIASYLE